MHSGWEIVVMSAVRVTACAGMLAAGLFVAGAGGGLAIAEPGDPGAGSGDSTGQGQDTTDSANDGATVPGSDGSNFGPPEARVVAEVEPRTPPSSGGGQTASASGFGRDGGSLGANRKPRRLTIHIPFPRVPQFDGDGVWEYPEESAFTTVVVEAPVVTTLQTLRSILKPEPSPDPSFRGEEEPPVLEASGDSDYALTGDLMPRVLEAPLVAPPPLAGPGAAPPGTVPTPPQIVAQPAPRSLLGSRAAAGPDPPISSRGVLPPGTKPPLAMTAAPPGTQMTRLGYRQYLRTATITEMMLIVLPGLMGLFVMTFSGGVIGYRQANAGRYLLTERAARFLQ